MENPSPEPEVVPVARPAALDPAAPPTLADGSVRCLDPRSIIVGRLAGGIAAAIVAVVLILPLSIVLLAAPLPGILRLGLAAFWFALVALLGLRAYFWPPKAYRFAAYKLDSDGLEIRRGVYWRRVINVPRARVQHTDVSQGPLERAYELGTLVIYTAGTSYARVDLHGLDHETALALRDLLLPREGDDAV